MAEQSQVRDHDRDLSETLTDYLDEWSGRTGIVVETWALPARSVPDHVARAVVACIVEALRNVELHSGARTVSVAVTTGESNIRLTVSDDGQGFAGRAVGRGVSSMRGELIAVDGEFSINGTPGAGTTIHGRAPLEG
ncbi:sensor histidine kinase [Nonomuraea sp. NPDC002799]